MSRKIYLFKRYLHSPLTLLQGDTLGLPFSDAKKYHYYRYLHYIRSSSIKIDVFDSIVCLFFNL